MKTILRSLWKNKSYGFLNIAGLTLGIVCTALLFLWVEDELTYDTGFRKHDRLYQVIQNQLYNGSPSTVKVTSGLLAPALKAEVPGIKNASRISGGTTRALFTLGNKSFYESGNHADSNFFSMFGLEFISGNPVHAFDQLHSLVINQTMAKKFFGEADPIGQTMKMDNGDLYTITGVFNNLPSNTTYSFSWLAPYELIRSKFDWLNRWDASGIVTLVELEENADRVKVDQQLLGFMKAKKEGMTSTCFLFAMSDWHLYNHFSNGKQDNDGQIKYVRLFALIASLVLIVACINFMNLATARSEQRAKEVGVKKALGAGRKRLIRQFISESLTMSGMAVLLAIGIVWMLLPGFNSLTGKQVELNLTDPLHFTVLILIGAVSGLLAGSYPAFYLSSFNPVMVLKGLKIKTTGSAAFVRKGLVTSQFVVSITLIICTIIIYQQVQHMKSRELGYDKDNVLYMDLHGKMQDQFHTIKTELINTGVVENAMLSINPTFQLGWFSGDNYRWPGKDPNKDITITVEGATPEYVSTMGLKIIDGRDFYSEAANDNNNVIINETLARMMGAGSPIGEIITQGDPADPESWRLKVVGVVQDFVFGNVSANEISPMIMTCNPTNYNYLTLRFKPDADLNQSLAKVETVMKSVTPEYPFEYHFMDDEFDKLFKTEALIEKLSGIFAALAIFISCLGLFGLAAYTAARRSKEVSIRKVLGASVSSLAGLLSKDFLKLVSFACVISFPLAWYVMSEWLKSYEYRTHVYWWVFAITGVGALIVALLTVSFQTIKAAIVNPVNTLRSE